MSRNCFLFGFLLLKCQGCLSSEWISIWKSYQTQSRAESTSSSKALVSFASDVLDKTSLRFQEPERNSILEKNMLKFTILFYLKKNRTRIYRLIKARGFSFGQEAIDSLSNNPQMLNSTYSTLQSMVDEPSYVNVSHLMESGPGDVYLRSYISLIS